MVVYFFHFEKKQDGNSDPVCPSYSVPNKRHPLDVTLPSASSDDWRFEEVTRARLSALTVCLEPLVVIL